MLLLSVCNNLQLTELFFLFSGLIGLAHCVVPCASTLHKTSTTSGVMSRAAMHMCSHSVHWHPVRSASSSATQRLSRSTCCTSMVKSTPTCSRQEKVLYRAIVEMRGISVENVASHPPLSLQSRSTSSLSTLRVWQNSTSATDYKFKVQPQRSTAARCVK